MGAQQNLNTGYGNPLGTQVQDYEVNRFGIFKNVDDMWRQTGLGERDRDRARGYSRSGYSRAQEEFDYNQLRQRQRAAKREAMKSEYPVLMKGEIYEIW